jgi:DNA recombination protein RmuC
MSPTQFTFLILILVAGFGALFWYLKNSQSAKKNSESLDDVVNKIFGLTTQKIAEQSRQILQSEKETIRVDMENKQQSIEKLVKNLQDELRERQIELRSLEQDRTKKFAELTTTLDQHRKLAEDLRVSTQQLASVLSNNQTRGAWGERIIEDLLKANGLIEGVHYLKQTKLNDTTLRPDITLLLPNKRNVPVDVKFPYAEIQKIANTDSKTEKEEHLHQFSIDLKNKITKVAAYIDPSYNTLDYAILFVPNEMVFSFINQRFPDLVDEAMARRVIIVSPFTFLIVARTVMESYRNFMIEDKLRDILQYVTEFTSEWGKFRMDFEKFGRSIETLRSGYETLSQTRTNQMERKIAKIETYRQGTLLGETAEVKAAKANPDEIAELPE